MSNDLLSLVSYLNQDDISQREAMDLTDQIGPLAEAFSDVEIKSLQTDPIQEFGKQKPAFIRSFMIALLTRELHHDNKIIKINQKTAAFFYGLLLLSFLEQTKKNYFYNCDGDKLNSFHLHVLFSLIDYCDEKVVKGSKADIQNILWRAKRRRLINTCSSVCGIDTIYLLYDFAKRFDYDFRQSVVVLISGLSPKKMEELIRRKLIENYNSSSFEKEFIMISDILHFGNVHPTSKIKKLILDLAFSHPELIKSGKISAHHICFSSLFIDEEDDVYINVYLDFLSNFILREFTQCSQQKDLLRTVLINVIASVGFVKSFDQLRDIMHPNGEPSINSKFASFFDEIVLISSKKRQSRKYNKTLPLFSAKTILTYVIPLFIDAYYDDDEFLMNDAFFFIEYCVDHYLKQTITIFKYYQFDEFLYGISVSQQRQSNISKIRNLIDCFSGKVLPDTFNFDGYSFIELMGHLHNTGVLVGEYNIDKFIDYLKQVDKDHKELQVKQMEFFDVLIAFSFECYRIDEKDSHEYQKSIKSFILDHFAQFVKEENYKILYSHSLLRQRPDDLKFYLETKTPDIFQIISINPDMEEQISLIFIILEQPIDFEMIQTSLTQYYAPLSTRKEIPNFEEIFSKLLHKIEEEKGEQRQNFAYFALFMFKTFSLKIHQLEPFINKITTLPYNKYLEELLIMYRRYLIANNYKHGIKQFDDAVKKNKNFIKILEEFETSHA